MVPWKAVFVLINVGIAWNRDCTLESCNCLINFLVSAVKIQARKDCQN